MAAWTKQMETGITVTEAGGESKMVVEQKNHTTDKKHSIPGSEVSHQNLGQATQPETAESSNHLVFD